MTDVAEVLDEPIESYDAFRRSADHLDRLLDLHSEEWALDEDGVVRPKSPPIQVRRMMN